MLRRLIFLCLIQGLSIYCASAQSALEARLDGSEAGKKLAVVLRQIEAKDTVRFFYLPQWLDGFSFDRSHAGETLGKALDDFFIGTDYSYVEVYPDLVVIIKDPTHQALLLQSIRYANEHKEKVDKVTIGSASDSVDEDRLISLSGRVTDSQSGAPLPHTNILVQDDSITATTDEDGKYSIELKPGTHVIEFSFINYEDRLVVVNALEGGSLDVAMEEAPSVLNEVVVHDHSSRELASAPIGELHIDVTQLKHEPALLGEADIIKHIQQTSGVTTVGEAASGFNVRGGSVDENLILYDGMPLFNSSHVFGFLSNLSADAIGNVSFYKGGISSVYGGRCSSVLDIRSRDGDFDRWHGAAGIGMINGRLSVNGPLKKGKTALAVTARSTYSNWLTHAVQSDYTDLKNSIVHFYDGTVKITHRLNSGSRLAISSYISKDAFRLGSDSTYQWSTFQLSSSLNKAFTEKLSADFRLGVNTYGYHVINDYASTASKLTFHITSPVADADFEYQSGKHKISFGEQFKGYVFNPGELKPESGTSNARRLRLDNEYSLENALYFSDGISINDRFFVEAGLRIPAFVSFGPASVKVYQPGEPLSVASVIDTIHYHAFQPIKAYLNLEPRLSARWMISPGSSIKVGYNRMTQYLHLVTNTAAVAPEDVWQPSGYYFKPERADQVSAGFFKDLVQGKFNLSVEGFYKEFNNVLDFKDGAQLTLNDHLETDLLRGHGTSYGAEFAITRNNGRLSWSFNYTYSRAFRQFGVSAGNETINDGKRYPANFDQPHVLNLSWHYDISRRVQFTGDFTYHTGRPITIPTLIFPVEDGYAEYFSDRNQYRIPDYHRLDFSLVVEGNHRVHRAIKGSWALSLYNVYARKNPYAVFFRTDRNGIPHPYQLSIIGTIFPSLSYNLNFE